jgi:motility quorum-sensing regulator/GCU-specific mRNA interferase toxin
VSEKRKPSYDLKAFQRAFASIGTRMVTGTALRDALSLGFGSQDMNATVQSMQPKHFYKSMTSLANAQEWQDVYHVPFPEGVLYVKFRGDTVTEFKLLSFKEK